MKHVNASVYIIVTAKSVTTGILAHVIIKMVSL